MIIEESSSDKKSLTKITVRNFLRITTLAVKFSFEIFKMTVDFDLFKVIENFLPSQEDMKKPNFSSDQYPFLSEAITVLETILPDREIDESTLSEVEKPKVMIEKYKRDYLKSLPSENGKILYIAEKLLPKIFLVYDNNM